MEEYCVNCNNKILPKDNFCTKCGTPVRRVVSTNTIKVDDGYDEDPYVNRKKKKKVKDNNKDKEVVVVREKEAIKPVYIEDEEIEDEKYDDNFLDDIDRVVNKVRYIMTDVTLVMIIIMGVIVISDIYKYTH